LTTLSLCQQSRLILTPRLAPSASLHIERCAKRYGNKYRWCDRIDGEKYALSGHAPDRQNPVNLEKLAVNIWMLFMTQNLST
jgi:hypothetical protein